MEVFFYDAAEKYKPHRGCDDSLFRAWFASGVFSHHDYFLFWGPLVSSTWKKHVYAGIQKNGTPVLVHVLQDVSPEYIRDEMTSLPIIARFENTYVTEWMEYNMKDYLPTNPKPVLASIVSYIQEEVKRLPKGRYLDLSPCNIWCDFQGILFFCDYGSMEHDAKSAHPDLILPNPNAERMALYSIGVLFKHCNIMKNISHVLCQTDPEKRIFNQTAEDTLWFLFDALKN